MTLASLLAHERGGPGDAPTILLLHAGVADSRMWDSLWDSLTRDFDVVRCDLRGFGSSTELPDGTLSHRHDVLALLDGLGVGRCHLVGASFGAGVAAEVAVVAPDRVLSLTLSPPGGSLLAVRTPDLAAFADAERAALAAGDLDAAAEVNVDTWVVGPSRRAEDVDPVVREAVRSMQRHAFEVGAAFDDVEEDELDPPVLDRLTEVIAPTLVLVGGHDLETTHDAADRLVAGLPDVRRVDWPDAAHLPSMEHPERFVDLLRDHLATAGD
ncbi:alpha/beta fold hydrolase [Phycicoccus avicenniae]|uniref:alpha/beta fold hydrolase n=1 Tax=Phycicoccus avicenniae TaxID=2828860 RepID=UPI003D2E02CF